MRTRLQILRRLQRINGLHSVLRNARAARTARQLKSSKRNVHPRARHFANEGFVRWRLKPLKITAADYVR